MGYKLLNRSSLSVKRVELFKIKRKISNLTYKFKLSEEYRIRPVVSVVHLE